MNVFTGRLAPSSCQTKRKKSLLYGFTVIYLFFLAFERIDLLQNQGSFRLSLELLGCIAFLICYLGNIIYHGGKLQLSNLLTRYTIIVFAFMATVLLSSLFSSDFQLSARRMLLLGIYAFSGLFAVNYLITRQVENMISMVVNSMVFLSVVYALCSLYDVFMWFNPRMSLRISILFPYFRSDISSIGTSFVRVRGASGDPNRAGIFMIVNSYIILQYCKRPTLKVTICVINVVILALTLSRTAALCLVLYAVLQMHISKKINKKNIFRVTLMIVLIIAMIAALYQIPVIQEAVSHTVERLQTRDASSDEHIRYIETGIRAAFSNIKIFLIGNGYGVSANILGGSGKYVNFHNAYVTFLAECGFLSVIFFILLILYPWWKNKSQFPIIAVLMLANIPYQIFIEPYFWFLLPFICVMPQLQKAASQEKDRA